MASLASWLSVTPEPERELPEAAATLAYGRRPTEEEVGAERARIERIVLRGGQRRWLDYLHRVVELIERRAQDPNPDVVHARARAREVIANHHNLLLGLPGRGAQRTAADRAKLTAAGPPTHDREGRP